jgi:hypothetical protein
MDRWEIITRKLLKKNQTKDISWVGGYKVAKIKVIDRDKKQAEMEILRRWSILLKGVRARLGQFKMMGANIKLSKLIWRYLKHRQLLIYGKFKSMARRFTVLKLNQRSMNVLGRWN